MSCSRFIDGSMLCRFSPRSSSATARSLWRTSVPLMRAITGSDAEPADVVVPDEVAGGLEASLEQPDTARSANNASTATAVSGSGRRAATCGRAVSAEQSDVTLTEDMLTEDMLTEDMLTEDM